MIIKNKIIFKKWVLAGCALSAMAATAPAIAQSSRSYEFDIDRKELGQALTEYGIATGQQVFFNDADVRGKTSNDLEGIYTPAEAVRLLLNDTGVEYRIDGNGTLLVGNEYVQRASLGDARTEGVQVAQLQVETASDAAPTAIADAETEGDPERVQRQDTVIVTGTLLRGVNPTSPVTVFDREDIDAGGFASTQDFLRALPQNFDQGQNTAAGRAGDTGGAPLGASPVNLRGLGNRATLVLINGKRTAPGAGGSQFADVNLIPLSAIERIEVLTDGASATYGTDAVAGVINLILKDDFDGSETRARFGGVTEGSSQQYALNQTLGTSWDSGNLLGSFEYFRQNNLDSSEREFTEDGIDPVDIIPRRETYSGFARLRQNLNEQTTVFVEGLFSQSEGKSNLQFDAGPLLYVENKARQYNINAGVEFSLPADWGAEIYGTISRNDGNFFQSRDDVTSSTADSKSEVGLIEARANGSVLSLPGGEAKLAVGAQFRAEDFRIDIVNFPDPPIVTNAQRDVYSVFAEVLLPIVGESNRRAGLHSLELSLSGRFEDYSDFGSTANPKVGFLYAPGPGLNVRGTYGTSFIAPSFQQLFLPVNATALPGSFSPLQDGSPGPDYLFVGGGNPGLVAEEAETWTIGFDAEPEFIDGLRISGTYYNIEFTDRIGSPLNGSVRTLFTNPNTIDQRFITFDPPLSDVEAYFQGRFLQILGDVTAEDIGAIIDARIQNSASTSTDGVDVSIEYERPFADGTIRFGLNGNYILSSEALATPNSDPVEMINNFAQPVDLRLRGSLGWSGDQLSTTLFVNYVDDYSSDRVGERVPVDSWTTFDVSVQYSLGQERAKGLLSGVRLALNVQNLFNKAPPFVESGIDGIFYDGNNANPLGRFVSLELSKSF